MELPKVLIVDDDAGFLADTVARLASSCRCITASSHSEAISKVTEESPDVVLLDIEFDHDMNVGFNILAEIQEDVQQLIPVIMLTRFDSIELAVEAVRRGAFDYVLKDCSIDELRIRIDRAISVARSARHRQVQQDLEKEQIQDLIGSSAAIRAVADRIAKIAPTRLRVLITGERGVGKELVAREIHRRSDRATEPLVVLNCPATPPQFAESELFGHVKGAFTGATQTKLGKVQLASQGTLFLNEIAHLDTYVQAKLLVLLDDGRFERLGGTKQLRTDARIIAATNQNLPELIRQREFLPDLYDRLNQVTIHVPALRERKEDIPIFVNHFLQRACRELGRKALSIDNDVVLYLQRYDWPGNVRELENAINVVTALSSGNVLRCEDFRFLGIEDQCVDGEGKGLMTYMEARKRATHKWKKEYLSESLRRASGNITLAAKMAGIPRRSFVRMMKEVELAG